jgi:hypothetical protein
MDRCLEQLVGCGGVKVLRHPASKAALALKLDLERVTRGRVQRHQPLGHREQPLAYYPRNVRAERAEALAPNAILDLRLLLDHLGEALMVVAELRLKARAFERRNLLGAHRAHRGHLRLLRPVHGARGARAGSAHARVLRTG